MAGLVQAVGIIVVEVFFQVHGEPGDVYDDGVTVAVALNWSVGNLFLLWDAGQM